jgi:hypothetical protein
MPDSIHMRDKLVAPTSALHRLFNIAEAVAGPGTRFASPMTRRLHDWWTEANGGLVPLKRQFDITEHRPIAANIFLTELTPEGAFRFKLLGENVIHMIGGNRTGVLVKSSPSARADFGHALDEYYWSIVRERQCKLCLGSLAYADKDFWRFESLDCPRSSDGERVDHLIGVMDIVD